MRDTAAGTPVVSRQRDARTLQGYNTNDACASSPSPCITRILQLPALNHSSGNRCIFHHLRLVLSRRRGNIIHVDQTHNKVPFLFGDLRDAQTGLFEHLHVFQYPAVFGVLLEFFEGDDLWKLLSELHMDETPLWVLAARFLVVIGMVRIKSGFWTEISGKDLVLEAVQR